MSAIKSAVGISKHNLIDDVRSVQRLLNARMQSMVGFVPLKDDGQFGPKTAQAILDFQSSVLHMKRPDGIVDPRGPTIVALTAGSHNAHHEIPPNVKSFIETALPAAKKVKAKWGVPIAATIAQSALETGWEKKVVANAYFGIKGKAPSGAKTSFGTTEVVNGKVIHIKDEFRAYKNYGEAADDYGRFLSENSHYKNAFLYKNEPLKFVNEVAKGGYATDPNYAKSLANIIRSYGLEQYDR